MYFLSEKERSKELYLQAYYTYAAFEDKSNQAAMQQEIKERLGIELTK